MLRTRVRAGAAAGLVLSLGFAALFTLSIRSRSSSSSTAGRPVIGERRRDHAARSLRAAHRPRSAARPDRTSPTSTPASSFPRAPCSATATTTTARRSRTSRSAAPRRVARISCLCGHLLHVCMMLHGVPAPLRAEPRAPPAHAGRALRAPCSCTMTVVKLLLLFTAVPEFWVPVAALPLWVSLVVRPAHRVPRELGARLHRRELPALRFDAAHGGARARHGGEPVVLQPQAPAADGASRGPSLGFVACGLASSPSPSCSRVASTSTADLSQGVRSVAARVHSAAGLRPASLRSCSASRPSGCSAPSRATSCST